jgi:glycosyltransferase involved in cell wall biosynthesis
LNKLISIITVCYNAENTISDTINSVLSQTYNNVEYIIIDGGSSDNTLKIIDSYNNSSIRILSEKDKGLYDALNKGINLSNGEVLGIIHSDDIYANKFVLENVMKHFEQNARTEAYSTSLKIYKNNQFDKSYRVYNAKRFKKWQFRLGMQPPHPSFFIRKKALENVGFYRTQYKISGDFEWLLRAIWGKRITVDYSSDVTVLMRDGGLSSSSWKNRFLMNNESLKILKIHGIYSNKLLIYSKYFIKVFQLKSI